MWKREQMSEKEEKRENKWIRRGYKQGWGGPNKEKRENKMISRGLKRWAGRAKLRKKEKTNRLVRAKNRGRGRPT